MGRHPHSTPEERFAAIVDEMRVTSQAAQYGKGFGSNGLRVGGKIFAMLVNDRLVVKLPKQRVDALIAGGEGERFDPGHGRLMREWLSLAPESRTDWLALAREAMEFVAGKP